MDGGGASDISIISSSLGSNTLSDTSAMQVAENDAILAEGEKLLQAKHKKEEEEKARWVDDD